MPAKTLNFFQRLSLRIEVLFQAVLVNVYTLLLLILLYFFYWEFGQAKDLLVTLNQESDWMIGMFFATMITMAGICWYLPRFIYKENNRKLTGIRSLTKEENVNAHRLSYYINKGKEMSVEEQRQLTRTDESAVKKYKSFFHILYKEMVPRFLGTGVLLVIGLGILNIGNEMELEGFPWTIPAAGVLGITALVVLLSLLIHRGYDKQPVLFALSRWGRERLGNWIYLYFGLVVVLLVFLMIRNQGDIRDLPYLLLATLVIAFSFLVFTIFRTSMRWVQRDKNVIFFLVVLGGITFVGFLLINAATSLSQSLNPLICANFAFIFYLSILYPLRIWGVRRKIQFVTGLVVLCAILYAINPGNKIYEVDYAENEFQLSKRDTLADYFESWVAERRGLIRDFTDSTGRDSFPVLVVSAEGGGSRAAYWTCLVHANLQRQAPRYYDGHLFALTGASGGNTGNSTLLAMKEGGVPDDSLHLIARRMFRQNFLSSSLTRLLGFDFWQEIVGQNLCGNRARILEKEWVRELQRHAPGARLDKPFLGYWYTPGSTELLLDRPPLLFINATHVQVGNHVIVPPVEIEETYYPGRDLLEVIDSFSGGQKTLRLATANLLNASFPYINPAGYVMNYGNFVDAGYYDNHGAQTAASILRSLQKVRAEKSPVDSLYQKLKFVSVLIINSSADPVTEPGTDNTQVAAPLSTLGNLRSAYNAYNRWSISREADAAYQFRLQPVEIRRNGERIKPMIPLARYLSGLALVAMDSSLHHLREQPEWQAVVKEMK